MIPKEMDWTEFDKVMAGFEGRAAHTRKNRM